MTQRILVTPGDGYGPIVVGAAESVISGVAPDLEILHGKIGEGAYETTGYALPPETLELISQCDAVLSGPIDMDEIPGRDPHAEIKKQMGLSITYQEFFPLCNYLGRGGVDLVTMSPTLESAVNVFETESLDGISSEYYTNSDNLTAIFRKCVELSEMTHQSEIHLVSDRFLYPGRSRLICEKYMRVLAGTEFSAKRISAAEAMFTLETAPSGLSALICDIHAISSITGQCTGIVGGSGLMPLAFVGNRKGLYTPSQMFGENIIGRELNPTSAILSAAVMLLHLGRYEEYQLIRKSVLEMYRLGHTTPDVGGKMNAEKFAEGVKDLIKAELN